MVSLCIILSKQPC